MYLSNAFVRRQASAIATIPARPGIIQRGQSDIGYNETVDLSAATLAWHRKVKFFSEENATGTNGADLSQAANGVLTLVTGSAGARQVETATCTGTITGTGNLQITVTTARLAAPVVLAVAVADGDLAGTWAEFVRDALAANASLAAYFTASTPSAGTVDLTSIDPYPNDGTLNIAIAAGTATGITAAPTSANTTAGVGGTVITPLATAVDIHGDALPVCRAQYLRFAGAGSGAVLLVHPIFSPAGFMLIRDAIFELWETPGGNDPFSYDDWAIRADGGAGEVDILCYATEA